MNHDVPKPHTGLKLSMAVFLGLDLGLDPELGGLAEAVAVSRKGTDGPESISPSLPLCLFLR